MSAVTPSQTVGPYFRIGLISDAPLWPGLTAGAEQTIAVRGVVLDGEGAPVLDALLEIWQPDQARFGRVETDPQTGRFEFLASAPRALRQNDGSEQAPHLAVGVFARGLLKRLYTRIYLADDPADPVLKLVPAARRSTLIARPIEGGERRFEFDIRLSGPGETVFFDC